MARRLAEEPLTTAASQPGAEQRSASPTERTEPNAGGVAAAAAYLQRLEPTLLTPDALHIAIAQRLGATLVTFDRGMAAAARALDMAVATP